MRNQLKIRLCTYLLIGAFLCSILPLASICSSSSVAYAKGSFPGIRDDFSMPTGTENDIYAVGWDGNVWHWNGAWWWQVTSGRVIEDKIQVVAQNLIYGLSRNPTGYLNIYKWDGTAWQEVTRDGSLIDSFEVISDTQIYAIGTNHQVYLWNGINWSGCTVSANDITSHIQIVNQQIYSINLHHEIVKWNSAEWEAITNSKQIQSFSLKSEHEIYSIDETGRVILWDGKNWVPLTTSFPKAKNVLYFSSSEVFVIGNDGMVWQWNGDIWLKITTKTTNTDNYSLNTYYRAKYIEGNLSKPPAMIAYKDKLIIASVGEAGGIYVREWAPSRNESWDTARNSQNLGADNWYALEGRTSVTPELKVKDGVLTMYVMGIQGVTYKKTYIEPHKWAPIWEQAYGYTFMSGPYNSAGFGIAPISSKGYPSPVAIVKYADFPIPKNQTNNFSQMVIYELTTKEFTSPNGPGTGTFASATEKFDYLKDLGINTIWLSGNSWSDPLHFTNTSTQYAVIDPTLVDPSLGSDPTNITKTEFELKDLIEAAHQRDIKVFFDAVSHGVMSYSPLVSKNISFPPYVPQYPVPLNTTAHPDWFGAKTFPPEEDLIDNASFPQNTHMIDFVGGYDQTDLDDWAVNVWTNYILKFGIDGIRIDLGSTRFDLWARIKENANKAGHDLIIMPEGEVQDYPFDVGIYDFEQVNYAWMVFAREEYNQTKPGYGAVVLNMERAITELFPKLPRQYNTVPISVHDSLSYNLEGDRFKMGYGAFFTPFIPVFMAGEEFNNPQSTVPNGTVPWLLSSPLQWDKLQQPQNEKFFNDIKKVIQIRQSEPALTYFSPDIHNPNVALVSYTSTSPAPCPYLRFLPNGSQAILITGNNNSNPITISMQLPLNRTDLEGYQYYDVVDLWNNKAAIMPRQDLTDFSVTVDAHNFSILKITPHTGALPLTFYWPILAASLTLIICFLIGTAFLVRNHKITLMRP